MIIANRGGHTKAAPGASDKIDELTEDRKVYKRIQELLVEVENTMLDCTPPDNYSFPDELNYGINKCNSSSAELFYSIHFNSTSGAYGSEVLIYPGTQLTTNIGNRILSNLNDLGFVNRGLKPRTDLGELTEVNCPSMIVEVCFVHEKDAAIYNSIGIEKVARAIANGIDSRVSLNKQSPPIYHVDYVIVYDDNSPIDKSIAETMHYILCNKEIDTHLLTSNEYDSNQYGDFRGDNIVLIGGKACNRFRYGTKLAGKDRYETSNMMYKYLKEKGF